MSRCGFWIYSFTIKANIFSAIHTFELRFSFWMKRTFITHVLQKVYFNLILSKPLSKKIILYVNIYNIFSIRDLYHLI
ncbi:MAG: hypothetical protein GF317_15610 [Candidatus Lokiarchaeota archaeon]|nr:hypothetical protein [Candidatus Lokiarchaeota archaeon]MBD3200990.1 hypothetical protein [Candidatus Lokiarchaeota archaeon]